MTSGVLVGEPKGSVAPEMSSIPMGVGTSRGNPTTALQYNSTCSNLKLLSGFIHISFHKAMETTNSCNLGSA